MWLKSGGSTSVHILECLSQDLSVYVANLHFLVWSVSCVMNCSSAGGWDDIPLVRKEGMVVIWTGDKNKNKWRNMRIIKDKVVRTKWWIWCAFWNNFQAACFISTNVKVSHNFLINPTQRTQSVMSSSEVHERFLQSQLRSACSAASRATYNIKRVSLSVAFSNIFNMRVWTESVPFWISDKKNNGIKKNTKEKTLAPNQRLLWCISVFTV